MQVMLKDGDGEHYPGAEQHPTHLKHEVKEPVLPPPRAHRRHLGKLYRQVLG